MRKLWFLLLLVESTAAVQCVSANASALALPLQDVLVAPNITDLYMIGIPATIGTPEQNVVLLPWAELNNTYIYDQNAFCDKTVIFSDTICLVRRGGFYRETSSTSFDQKLGLVDAGGASQETSDKAAEVGIKDLVLSSLGGTDKINIASTGVIGNFPVGIPRQPWDGGYSTLHPLGLGRNSTYLNMLYKAGRIPSRVWSIYWGRMWTKDNPLNGTVVLGGYDERKVIGDNFTRQLDYTGGCFTGLKATITDIVLNFRTGQKSSLLTANTAITACIVPTRQLLFQGPSSVLDAYQRQTGINSTGLSFGIHWSALMFDADNVYDGDITIELESSMQVRIPNDQFVTPSVAFERNGSRTINQNARDVLLGEVDSQVATLGRYFLTASYLMLNYEESTWTLWKANPTTRSSLKSVLPRDQTCSGSVNGTTVSSSPRSKSALSSASIAGIVLGIVFAFLAALIFWCVYKRWKRLRKAAGQKMTVPPAYAPPGPQELHNIASLRHDLGFANITKSGFRSATEVAQLDSNEVRGGIPGKIYYEMPVTTYTHHTPVLDDSPARPTSRHRQL